MLFLTVDVLERFPEAREKWQEAFRYILVDEYQDTNHAQYRLLQLLAEKHRNLFAVGDPDQCLVEGTLVTMADGTRKPIEEIEEGDEVLSCLWQRPSSARRESCGLTCRSRPRASRSRSPRDVESSRLPSTCISRASRSGARRSST